MVMYYIDMVMTILKIWKLFSFGFKIENYEKFIGIRE